MHVIANISAETCTARHGRPIRTERGIQRQGESSRNDKESQTVDAWRFWRQITTGSITLRIFLRVDDIFGGSQQDDATNCSFPHNDCDNGQKSAYRGADEDQCACRRCSDPSGTVTDVSMLSKALSGALYLAYNQVVLLCSQQYVIAIGLLLVGRSYMH